MEIEVEAPQEAAVLTHFVGFDRGVPNRSLGAPDLHTKELRGYREHPVPHGLEGKVGPDLTAIERVIGSTKQLARVPDVPGGQAGDRRILLPDLSQEPGREPCVDRSGDLAHPADERPDRIR